MDELLLTPEEVLSISSDVLGVDWVADIGANNPTLAYRIGEIQKRTAKAQLAEAEVYYEKELQQMALNWNTIVQTNKVLKYRDRPDREKIARLEFGLTLNLAYEHEFTMASYNWDELEDRFKEYYYHRADQILALFNEEEIRKQERERILEWGDERCVHHYWNNHTPYRCLIRRRCPECWQALKKGEGE